MINSLKLKKIQALDHKALLKYDKQNSTYVTKYSSVETALCFIGMQTFKYWGCSHVATCFKQN